MDEAGSKLAIKLEPFIHQVGGHSSMLCLDEYTVCKPLVKRELEFYETLPDAIRKFTPKFHGTLQVKAVPEEDGYISLIAIPTDSYSPKQNQRSTKRKIRIRRTGSIETEGDNNELFEEDSIIKENQMNIPKSGVPVNPWVLQCYERQLQKMISTVKVGEQEPNFILLENLASRFTYPCILDLKMGTRQYGDTASLPKKQSKMFKVVSTTSGKLGVRIGGMQVYQVTTQRFVCRNKFFGRSLSVGGFQQAVRQFLHNGSHLRSDVLGPLIRRLEELAAVVTQQEATRFYTTSLLLIYDGLEHSCTEGKMKFDFEIRSLQNSAVRQEEEKTAFMQGSRRSSSVELLDRPLKELTTDEVGIVHRRCSSVGLFDDAALQSPLPSPRPPVTTVAEPSIDVRIIDFAHSTHKGMDNPVIYSGPDRGFLFGLENMISILKGIERDHG
ncbi:inositol hexakisphosphate kinase 3-like [Schistocerca cancellata]|uniref:inositol hexakisphosphate kinase 3-like n=1 Tax=Schistocerca cancellata TaxID=274614 RepID=UPI0021178E9F|nr:inositol hexakisphosphate kinase 3-like [Schistocerca cancellata]